MFLGIFLLLGRREQVVLRVVIDHGLCEDLVLRVPFGRSQLGVHEGGYLIHYIRECWGYSQV